MTAAYVRSTLALWRFDIIITPTVVQSRGGTGVPCACACIIRLSYVYPDELFHLLRLFLATGQCTGQFLAQAGMWRMGERTNLKTGLITIESILQADERERGDEARNVEHMQVRDE
uniref:Putative secreted peptide n=1 Tax=Anopheles braziliensis TaxID=58242 RepID=A0A2M3ZTG1_9DIPT